MANVVKVTTTHDVVIHKAAGFMVDLENGYLNIIDAEGDMIAAHAPHDWLWVTEAVEDG